MQEWFCCRVLPKPTPGSSRIRPNGDAGRRGKVERALKEALDVVENVDRRIRLLAVVHDDDRRPGLRDGVRHAGIALQSPDVVDEASAEPRRLARHRRLAGVNGDRRIEVGQRLEHRNHPPELFGLRNRKVAGPCRFAADVDDRRALCDHRSGARDRGGRLEMAPPSENESGVTLRMPMSWGDDFSALRNWSRWRTRRSIAIWVG